MIPDLCGDMYFRNNPNACSYFSSAAAYWPWRSWTRPRNSRRIPSLDRIAQPLCNLQRLRERSHRLAHLLGVHQQLAQFAQRVGRAGLVADAALDLQALLEAGEGLLAVAAAAAGAAARAIRL